jgi:hypothetical protein
MNPGVSFLLEEDSSAQMVITAFADTRVELLKGSSTVQIIERLKDTNFSLTVGEAQIVFDKAGFMHVDTQPARIVVYTGQANVRLGGKVFEVTGGKTLDFANGASATVQKFDKDQTEALDRWSMRRGEVLAQANASAARNCFIGQNCGPGWNWNSRFGMMVYIPVGESLCDPFLGYCFYNPLGIRQARTIMSPPPAWAPMPTASTGGVAPTSTGYSGAGAAAHSTAAAPAASSSASGSSAGTVGQGTAAGNRGR